MPATAAVNRQGDARGPAGSARRTPRGADTTAFAAFSMISSGRGGAGRGRGGTWALPRRGVGRLTVTAVLNKDYPLIQGVVLVSALGYVLVNLLVDLSYSALDPRIRHREAEDR